MTAISIHDLSLRYGARTIFSDLSMEIERGEFVVLLGPSGCGKSTLLNVIAGLVEPDSGKINIMGKDVTTAQPSERGIGMVFQSYALYPRMTVRQNLSFGLKVTGTPKGEIERRVNEAAAILKLTELLDRRPAEMSGGQRQRVAIGRALVRNVDVFLFDEPLSNLDANLRTELRLELKQLHKRLGNTMVFVTHDQVEAMTLADRIVVLKDGVVQQIAPPTTIYARPANMFVAKFIGSPSINLVSGRIDHGDGFVFVADDMSIGLSGYADIHALSRASLVTMGIRPEQIFLGRKYQHYLCGRVTLIESHGADAMVWLQENERRWCLRCESRQQPAIGDELEFSFDPADALFYRTDDGILVE